MFEKPSCYHDGHGHMGSEVLWKLIVTQHSPPQHQEMQLESSPSSLGPKSSEMDLKTVETCSLVRLVHISTCVWENVGLRLLHAKDEKDHPDCYQREVKNQSLMVWGCISAHGMGDQNICEGTIDAEAYWNFGETYAAV